jgi:hypothetical protein
MDKYAKLGNLLGGKAAPITIMVGEVTAITGETCSVKVAEFVHKGVRLRLTDDALTDKILITPALGSFVLLADLSGGESRTLTVIDIEKPGKIEYKKGSLSVEISDVIKITNAALTVEIGSDVKVKAGLTVFEIDATGVKIANAMTNLRSLLINMQLGVFTNASILGNAGSAAQMQTDIVLLLGLLR